ncbi:GH25 family lysozyme [Lacticaseibacillus sp. GG6-2]
MRSKRPIYADTYERRRRWVLTGAVVVVVIALISGGWWWLHRNPRPSAQRYPVMGVRVDQTLGVIDADSLQKGGANFIYLKATQGASFVDDNFASNYSKTAGLKVGVYHYFSFDSTPQAQATNFIDHVQTNIGSLPVGIYLTNYGTYANNPPKDAAQRVQIFVTLLQRQYGCAVVLMGKPSVLASVKQATPTSPRWVISDKRPKSGQFWEYADAKLPHGSGDQAYPSAVYIGSRADFAKLATN